MSDQSQWERQKREIDACNVFYSSFVGIENESSLMDLGYISPIRFPEIPIRGRSQDAEPDFVTFNDSVLLLIEIKSGKNLNDSYLRQMERCNAVTIEDGQEFLNESDYFSRHGFDHKNLSAVESCIVFIKEQYNNYIDQSYNQNELSDLVSYGPVLSQGRGKQLTIERGGYGNSELDSFLSKGISLPKIPPTAVFLNEEVEKESLAVSICYDQIIPDLKHGPTSITTTEIRDMYPERTINIDDLLDVMTFLGSIGACDQTGDREYTFDQTHGKALFGVKDVVAEQRVDEYLQKRNEDQSDLGEF